MEKTEAFEYQRDEHRVHLIVYHLIWCPRRRKPILTGHLKDRFEELVKMKCQEKGWVILTLATQPDHIHLFVRVWPCDSASEHGEGSQRNYLFSSEEGISGLILSKLPSLWTRSYFASTSGAVSAQTIQHSIDAQKGV